MRLSLPEPPLRKEVVEYILDVDLSMWSIEEEQTKLFQGYGRFGWVNRLRKMV